MDKKHIFITGCSSGIGYFCAKQLLSDGYKVVASCRKQTDTDILMQQGITCITLDLADEASIQAGYDQALELLDGRIDVLFNNGAYGQPGAVEDLPTDALRQQFEVNLFGWHSLTRRVVALMRQQNNGVIVQNSSVLGLVTLPYRGAYNASKFALEGLTDTLRQELSDTNINVCLIEPGPITSKFRDNALVAFEKYIDIDSSAHKQHYEKQRQRLSATKGQQPFTLGPEAVYVKLKHAITAKRPKPRYYVTFPTYLFGYLKRIVSTRMMDRILIKSK